MSPLSELLSSLAFIVGGIAYKHQTHEGGLGSFLADLGVSVKEGIKVVSSTPIDTAGFVAVVLADLPAIQQRTALTGTSRPSDIFLLAPGLHLQQRAVDLHRGEHPACALLTTGSPVSRVENPATVYYLQHVARPGHLTTLSVVSSSSSSSTPDDDGAAVDGKGGIGGQGGQGEIGNVRARLPVWAPIVAETLTKGVLAVLYARQDWWGLLVVSLLMFCRACSIWMIRRRQRSQQQQLGWSGQQQSKTGVKQEKQQQQEGDLLILLSQNRWVRLRGAIEDLEAVTVGSWLREPTTTLEGFVTSLVTVTLYLTTALAGNASTAGKMAIAALLLVNVVLLALANTCTDTLRMHGRIVRADAAKPPKRFATRREMAQELIDETGTVDWAVRMGIISSKDGKR